MKIVRTSDKGFEKEFKRIVSRGKSFDPVFEKKVSAILRDVEKRGDRALFEYTKRFDGVALTAKTVEVSPLEIREALCDVTKPGAGCPEACCQTHRTLPQASATRLLVLPGRGRRTGPEDRPPVSRGRLCPRRACLLSLDGSHGSNPRQDRRSAGRSS